MEYLYYITLLKFVSVGQILNPLYFCYKELLPLLVSFPLISSSPFLKVRNNLLAGRCCLSPEKFFGIWAQPGWFQEVSCVKLPAMLSWNLFKALVTGRILLSLAPTLLTTGLRPDFERRRLWNKHIVCYSDKSLISVAFSVKCLVVFVLRMDYLQNNWAGSRVVVTVQILWGVKFTAW